MRFLIRGVPEREENITNLMAANALSSLKDRVGRILLKGEMRWERN